MTIPSKSRAIDLLAEALDEIPELKKLSRESTEFAGWRRDTEISITHIFGDEGRHLKEFKNISFTPPYPRAIVVGSGVPDRRPKERDYQERFERGLDRADTILKSMIREIERTWEDVTEENKVPNLSTNGRRDKTRVFVVHGRDEGTKHTVARFLENNRLRPVILGEQPDEGLTIIEKFEKHAQNVGFAVILLTPDDVGALQGEENNLKPRARQNVILELGYFIGRLGRNRVCALLRGDLEKPSDYHGVIYIPMDDHGAWQQQLIKNLEAADLEKNAG